MVGYAAAVVKLRVRIPGQSKCLYDLHIFFSELILCITCIYLLYILSLRVRLCCLMFEIFIINIYNNNLLVYVIRPVLFFRLNLMRIM